MWDNIKMHLKYICEDADWIHQLQDRFSDEL